MINMPWNQSKPNQDYLLLATTGHIICTNIRNSKKLHKTQLS